MAQVHLIFFRTCLKPSLDVHNPSTFSPLNLNGCAQNLAYATLGVCNDEHASDFLYCCYLLEKRRMLTIEKIMKSHSALTTKIIMYTEWMFEYNQTHAYITHYIITCLYTKFHCNRTKTLRTRCILSSCIFVLQVY